MKHTLLQDSWRVLHDYYESKAPIIREAYWLENETTQNLLSAAQSHIDELHRIVNEPRLVAVWPKVERLIQHARPTHYAQVAVGGLLLQRMVQKGERLRDQTDAEEIKKLENVTAKVKALKRATEATNIPGMDSMCSLQTSVAEQLTRIKEGRHIIRLSERYKLAPKNEGAKNANHVFLSRLIAKHFHESCGKLPYAVIAELANIALPGEIFISADTVRKDIQRLNAAAKKRDISIENK